MTFRWFLWQIKPDGSLVGMWRDHHPSGEKTFTIGFDGTYIIRHLIYSN